jgi:hypothetical protein
MKNSARLLHFTKRTWNSYDEKWSGVGLLSVGGLTRLWLRRSQVVGFVNKELDGDMQIAKQQQSLSVRESEWKQEGTLPKKGGRRNRLWVRWLKSSTCSSKAAVLGSDGYFYTTRGEQGKQSWVTLRNGFWWFQKGHLEAVLGGTRSPVPWENLQGGHLFVVTWFGYFPWIVLSWVYIFCETCSFSLILNEFIIILTNTINFWCLTNGILPHKLFS